METFTANPGILSYKDLEGHTKESFPHFSAGRAAWYYIPDSGLCTKDCTACK